MAAPFITHYLELTCGILAASVRLNDVGVQEDTLAMNIPKQIPVNQWLYNGKNMLSVRCWAPPGTDPADMSGAKVTVRILSLEKGKGEEDLKEVFTVVFPTPGQTPKLPAEVSKEFELKLSFGPWAWRKGEAFAADKVPLDEISAFAERARGALVGKDIDAVMELMNRKNSEMGAAFDIPEKERLADSREFMGRLFATRGWAMEKPDYAAMQTRLHAEGRLVEVLNAKGKELLETPSLDGEFTFCLPLWLAKVEGEWVLCR